MNELRKKILADINIFPHELNRIISTAPHRYKVYFIPKRNSKELRRVAQPAQELKTLQLWLIDHIKMLLPVHNFAVAYRDGVSIKHNALMHSNKRYVLKMDFQNFFPSIKQTDIERHFAKYFNGNLDSEDLNDITRLTLWAPPEKSGRQLCIGAPSSPFLSNSILFDFDNLVHDYCVTQNVTYSRYADDLVFSTNEPNILTQVEGFIYKAINLIEYPKLKVNEKKTIHTSKGRGISVTGVVITPIGKLSIGRDRKRTIRSSIDYFNNSKLSYKEVAKLNGLLAFAQDIEPSFIASMKMKYGKDFLNRIRVFLSENVANK